MGKRRGGHSGREDQFGDFASQDRGQDRGGFGGGHRSGGGGGTAGSQTRHKGQDLSFQKHVPKFLQQYQHLLGKGKGNAGRDDDEDAPVVAGGADKPKAGFEGWSDDEGDARGRDRDDDVEADALRRAMEENPQLAAEFEGKLQEKLKQAQAVEEKEKGNRAFSAKKYQEAIASFTKCIELDPQGEVYWSNRSAAHAALEDWEAAARDAKQAVQLKPRWAKAHSRLAVAFYGLKLYSDAVESYKRALAIEPDDQALQRGFEKAQMMEMQHIKDRKHVFFNKKQKLASAEAKPVQPRGDEDDRKGVPGGGVGGKDRQQSEMQKDSASGQGQRQSTKAGTVGLSFEEDDA